MQWWRDDGVFGVRESQSDIVAEWVEPKRIKGWLNIYYQDSAGDFQAGYVFAKRAMADKQCGDATRIACIEIDVPEGHGMEGGQ